MRKNKIKVCELTNLYLDEIKLTYKKLTYEERETIIKKYLLNFLKKDEKIINEFNTGNIINFRKYISTLNLSISRKNLIFSTTRQLISFAEENDYLDYTISERLLKSLKSIRKDKEISRKICFWTNEQFETFIDTFNNKDKKWRYYFLLTYWGALRMGEINALTWEDIDFNNNSVYINKSVDRDGYISSPKTKSSKASVDLPTFLITELKDWKEKVKPTNESDFIFFSNHIISRTSIRRMMLKHEKIGSVEPIKFHGLRHSMASRMINQGCNPLLVAKHLRHASTQQTLDTYSHLFPNITDGLMDKLV